MKLTVNSVEVLAALEGICLTYYLDSVKVPTIGMGLTEASGVDPLKYGPDNPQTLATSLTQAVSVLRSRYLPDIDKAFAGTTLTEAQFAGALSFHWNTGKIGTAHWVTDFRAGDKHSAETLLHQWDGHGSLTSRRNIEAGLLFHEHWPASRKCPVRPVSADHHPVWNKTELIDLRLLLSTII